MTRPRPRQLTAYNASAFQLADVVDAYDLRTPYPSGLAPTLASLMQPPHGAVLELGCGPGTITCELAEYCSRIDAVDISAPMVEVARARCGQRNVRWIHGSAETVELDGPYALVLSGDAMGWMDWEQVILHVGPALAEGGVLALVTSRLHPPPWQDQLRELIGQYSVMQDFDPYDFVDEITFRGLFLEQGRQALGPEPFVRSVDEYIRGIHASAGLARERMGERTGEFDRLVRNAVEPFAEAGEVTLLAECDVVWGLPLGAK